MSILRSSTVRSTLLLSLVAFVYGCSDTPTSSTPTESPLFATNAYCALHPEICTPSTPDPAPSAPGYYAGGELTDQYCAGMVGGINDADLDLLSDDCESWLALRFAPSMKYDAADDVRRESYWAARPIKPGVVRVFYALAYYFDLGTIPEAYTSCTLFSGFNLVAKCYGHHGDSEYVRLDLRYNASTKHWFLVQAKLSRHEDYFLISGGPDGYPTLLSYPNKIGGYPEVFVARQKHANYPSRKACNDGGGAPWPLIELFPYDDCSPNSQVFRPEVSPFRNLGSNARRLLDCVASTYSFYQSPIRKECMWSGTRFYGWQLDRTTSASGYGGLLRVEGF